MKTRGQIVSFLVDTGCRGLASAYGIVVKAGPKTYTVLCESGIRNRVPQSRKDVKVVTDPETLEEARKGPLSRFFFEAWKEECRDYAEDHLGLADILAKDDPYDLFDAMAPAFKAGQSAETFIRTIFAEDFARQEADEQDAQEAFEQGLEE